MPPRSARASTCSAGCATHSAASPLRRRIWVTSSSAPSPRACSAATGPDAEPRSVGTNALRSEGGQPAHYIRRLRAARSAPKARQTKNNALVINGQAAGYQVVSRDEDSMVVVEELPEHLKSKNQTMNTFFSFLGRKLY